MSLIVSAAVSVVAPVFKLGPVKKLLELLPGVTGENELRVWA